METQLTFSNQAERLSFWQTHIERLGLSGLSQQAYCNEHRLKKSALSYWKLKLRTDGRCQISGIKRQSTQATKVAVEETFVEVTPIKAAGKPLIELRIDSDLHFQFSVNLSGSFSGHVSK